MKRTSLAALLLIGSLFSTTLWALACGNDDGVLDKIDKTPPRLLPFWLLEHSFSPELMPHVERLLAYQQRRWAILKQDLGQARNEGKISGPSLDNAYAVTLMRLGLFDEALQVLEKAERRWPNHYATAANLGTSYELSGQLDRARDWIAEGIRRNPGSHSGTEWLHVEILDASIQLAREPAFLDSHSVLGLDFGKAGTPKPVAEDVALKSIQALEYQLRERVSFVKPPDAVVGDLFFDLGNLAVSRQTPQQAVVAYRLAQIYAPDMKRPLKERLEFAEKLMAVKKNG